MTRKLRSMALASVAAGFALIANVAVAQSYTGNWPANVTKSQRSNGAFCISLTDNGSYGAPHSGPATLLGTNNPNPGYFTVINGLITVTFTYPSGLGDCCDYQVFTAKASSGQLGNGAYNYLGITDFGVLTFGKKNGCSD